MGTLRKHNKDRKVTGEHPVFVDLSYLPSQGEAFGLHSYRFDAEIYCPNAIAPTVSLQNRDAPESPCLDELQSLRERADTYDTRFDIMSGYIT